MYTLKLKIGKSVLEIQANDLKEICKKSAVLGMLPDKCDNCSGENLYLFHKAPKENDYYGIACKDCGAELLLHQKKAGGFYMVAGEKMSVYQKAEQEGNSAYPEPESEEIPF